MMTTDLYLKDLAARLYRFQQENILCDTVLIAENDCKVWAHSVILAAISHKFYTNFLPIPDPKAKRLFSMKLNGCSVACVKAVLRFLYTGSFVLPSGFQHPDQFIGILMVCERLGIDMAKLHGVSIRFDDVSSLQASDLTVSEENVHGAAAFNACGHTEDAHAASVETESASTEMQESVCHVNLLSKEGESSSLETALPVTMSPTCKTLNTISRKVPQSSPEDSPGAQVSVHKGSKASAVRRNTSIRLAAKVLEKIGTKKKRTVKGNFQLIHDQSSCMDFVHSETEPLMSDYKNNAPLSCQARENKLTSESGLRKHFGGHVSDLLACRTCDKTFTTVQKLQDHEKLHAGERPHACTTCGKTYRFRGSLIQHLHVHKEKQHLHVHKEKRPYLCDICGAGFRLPVTMRRHKMARHSTERPFVCRECGRGFLSSYILRQHMENHTGQPSNICPQCGKSFSHRGNLSRHLREHDDKKQYVCNVCGRGFNQKSNMKQHILFHTRHVSVLTHRRDEQQHVCNECKKVFRSAKMLSRHASLHSSDESFKCELCAKRFSSVRSLKLHRKVHREKRFKCNVCEKKFKWESFLSRHMKKFHSEVDSLPAD